MKNIDDLKKKYWEGTSELDEERSLKKHFRKSEEGEPEDTYFNFLDSKGKEIMNDPDFDQKLLDQIGNTEGRKRSLFQRIKWRYAAAVLLLITAGILYLRRELDSRDIFTSTDQKVTEDTFEDPLLAYEETKKALLLLSSKLNKGNAYTSELIKFSQSQENLKKNN